MNYYDPKAFKQMMRDSGMKMVEIAKLSKIGRNTLYELTLPKNAHRLTLDKISRVAKITNMNASSYFPDIAKNAMSILEEPRAVYESKKNGAKCQEYMEDILLRMNGFRDDYINQLKYNIQMQEQVIEMMREKQAQQSA